MKKMFVCNIPTYETVNLRSKPNKTGSILIRIPYGECVYALPSSTAGWHHATYKGKTGFIQSTYLNTDDSKINGGGESDIAYPISTIIDTKKNGVGGKVKLRKEASALSKVLLQIEDESTIQVERLSGEWLPAIYGITAGYIMGKFIVGADAYGGDTGDETHDESVNVTIDYDSEKAVKYAINHSETTKDALCSNRNISFGSNKSNDCANFVSQCLCAGGLPMFSGWSYQLSGIPKAWRKNTKWSKTYSCCLALVAKGRLSVVPYSDIKRGDIIYSYKALNAIGKQYTHVTIATSDYAYNEQKARYGCNVCGHTANQCEVFKELTATNCKCYRVNASISVSTDEKRLRLPEAGNGFTLLV